jgi:hypothetical protein
MTHWPLTERSTMTDYPVLITAGGRIQCRQCAAKSKRTGVQCRMGVKPDQRVCKFHGGKSTGPKTEAGRKRCAEAKTIHGQETRAARAERKIQIARLQLIEAIGHSLGMFTGGKTRGPKVK